jgi:putative ABC transport system permease protein
VLSVPVGQIVVFGVLAGLIGVLAALWPARRAAKLDVLRAVTTE